MACISIWRMIHNFKYGVRLNQHSESSQLVDLPQHRPPNNGPTTVMLLHLLECLLTEDPFSTIFVNYLVSYVANIPNLFLEISVYRLQRHLKAVYNVQCKHLEVTSTRY